MLFFRFIRNFYLEPPPKLQQTNFFLATKLAVNKRETINADTIHIWDEVIPGMVNKAAWFKVRKKFLYFIRMIFLL